MQVVLKASLESVLVPRDPCLQTWRSDWQVRKWMEKQGPVFLDVPEFLDHAVDRLVHHLRSVVGVRWFGWS